MGDRRYPDTRKRSELTIPLRQPFYFVHAMNKRAHDIARNNPLGHNSANTFHNPFAPWI